MQSSFGNPIEFSGLRVAGLADAQISSPTNGQVLAYQNGAWKNSSDSAGSLPLVTNVTSSGTFVFQNTTKFIQVKVWAAGGAGGGAVGGANVSIGAPGGAGAFIWAAGPLPSGVCDIVVGPGGTPVSGGQGGNGGDSGVSWTDGSYVIADGGGGGNSVESLTNLAGMTQPIIGYNYVPTASAASANFTILQQRAGNMGEYSIVFVGDGISVRPRNRTPEISPNSSTQYNSFPLSADGESASANSGEGGAGGVNTSSSTESAGGAGGSGFVQIIEFS